jgi:hypothetical protein
MILAIVSNLNKYFRLDPPAELVVYTWEIMKLFLYIDLMQTVNF